MKFFRLSHASLCAIAASLLLAACGGDGDSSPTPPPSPTPGAAALPDVPNGRATLLAGSLEADPAKACGRVDADDPLQSRFGYITHAMTVAADGAVYLTDQPCRADSGQADAVRKIAPNGQVSTVATGALPQAGTALSRFVRPAGLAVKGGMLYVSDGGPHGGLDAGGACETYSLATAPGYPAAGRATGIWQVAADGRISAVAGVARASCEAGAASLDGAGPQASFCLPAGMAFSADGVLHVMDARMQGTPGTWRTVHVSDGNVQSGPAGRFTPNLIGSADGRIYVTDSCPAAGRVSRLVSVPDLSVLTDQLPNSSLVAIDSRGNVYSASADARRDGVKSTLYRKAAGQTQFVPVASNVRALRALAVGPDDALYLKSGHAVVKITFNP